MAPLINSREASYLDPSNSYASPLESLSSPPYERPQPRPPKTPAHAAQIRVRNRRREWLSRHPSYFRSLEHELADPALYDALIRRFQSHEEREKEGRAKGFGRVLEVDLLRGEARLSKLANNTRCGADPRVSGSPASESLAPTAEPTDSRISRLSRSVSSPGTPDPNSVPETEAEMNWEELEALEAHDLEKRSAPQTAEEGRMRWDEFLRLRFVAGGDEDFDYPTIDEDDEYDALERREQEDTWFDNEEPGWFGESDYDYDDETGPNGEGKKSVERPLMGETGVQDF
ncbi:coiled-coil domain-containing protein-domain-containing protein [Ustulina deusta]|nr:coiled-coil domain-containing protein-domain-containing protein [Ustulina deusta]KAI3340990.1 coiled-coil domain-containing protein-domain-containing protein [Ustulina deusta]